MTETVEDQMKSQERFNRSGAVDANFVLSQDRLAASNVAATPQWERKKSPYTPDFPGFPKASNDTNRHNGVLRFYYSFTLDDSEQACNAGNIPAPSFTSILKELVKTLTTTWDQTLPAAAHRKVRGAPDWLLQRMEAVRQMPLPTLEEVRTQLKASAGAQRKFDGKQIG